MTSTQVQVASSLRTTARSLYTGPIQIIGASFFETAMRPNPKVTVVLDDMDVANGALRFVHGSHKEGLRARRRGRSGHSRVAPPPSTGTIIIVSLYTHSSYSY